jgi:hypothetical protein
MYRVIYKDAHQYVADRAGILYYVRFTPNNTEDTSPLMKDAVEMYLAIRGKEPVDQGSLASIPPKAAKIKTNSCPTKPAI